MSQLSHASILSMGRYRDLSIAGVDPNLVQRLYRFLQRLRRCEEALIQEYHPADEMRCPVHFCVGQEAMPAAVSALIGPEDYLFSHHRSHGYYLAKGAPMNALFAELYGRETGANGGIAGSQDISMPDVKFYSGAILSGAVGIAVGAALSAQIKNNGNVAVAGFGEGATDEGAFWEALSYAALRKLPIVFLCENNLYATYSPQTKRQPADNISQRVEEFGLMTHTLFGNDVINVHRTVAEALEHARDGRGPVFVEAYTYRWYGHVGPEDDDIQGYRPLEELAFWKDNCPLLLLEERMQEAGLLHEKSKARVIGEVDREIEEAFHFAKSSPFPKTPDWKSVNYGSTSPEADQLLQDSVSSEFNQSQADAIPQPY